MNNIKNELYENGYIIIKDLLSKNEVEKLSENIKKICEKKNSKRIDDLYNYEEFWNFIINKNLLKILRKNISENIYYMHDSGISHFDENYDGGNKNLISWHRDTDSAPKIKDVVPYYKKGKFYEVFTAITYVSPNNKGGTLNLIPKSHNKEFRFGFKNLLRIFHWKTKNKKRYFFIRNIIEKLIGKNCKVDSGDCIVFFTTLFHKVEKSESTRQAIVARYAPKGDNSENYINYVLKNSSNDQRNGYKINNENSEKIKNFFNILKNEKVFYELEDF
tara:strand:- start:311 stop:1135 length:825 start_codon:yes stop_codon:yes gene_type:complete